VDPRDDRILNTSTNLGCGDGSLHVGDGSLDDGCVLVILLCVSLTIFCLLPLATLQQQSIVSVCGGCVQLWNGPLTYLVVIPLQNREGKASSWPACKKRSAGE